MANENSFSGPHLFAAFLCEKILIERDNVPTFVRVAERFMVPVFVGQPPAGVQLPPQIVQTTLVVGLKSGDLGAGKHTVRVKMQKPDGSYLQENLAPVFFNGGDDNGALIGMPIAVMSPDEGLYWFEIYFEAALLTRVPMRVLHQEIGLPSNFPPSGEQ
jgi:hypothetical protein